MTRLTLRPGQERAVGSIYKYFGVEAGHPVLEAPTSAGKSLIQAAFIEGVLKQWPGQRILCLAHVVELIEQNYLELMGYWPEAPAGINASQLNRRNYSEPIIFAMIQSVHKDALRLGWFDLVIIDECHLVPVKTSDGMYRKFLAALAEINPAIKVIGLSATPYRLDNGLLTQGKNRLFTDVIPAKANGISIDELLEAGYLAPVFTPDGGVETRLDVDGVKKAGGDYNQKQLAAAVDVDDTTRAAVAEIVAHGADRKSWLVFATSVAHAHHIAEELEYAHGIDAEVVTGQTPKAERKEITERFKKQSLRCLVNVNCLTTGFNARCTDLLAFLRPTHSTNLYVQMVGRGMRLSPETGKVDCMVLDFAGLIDKHGPVNDVTPPPKRGEGGGEAPIKECDQCYMLIPAGQMTCQYCGYEFPPPEPSNNISDKASTAEIIKRPGAHPPEFAIDAPERLEVAKVTFHAHHKPGKPSSIRVDYWGAGNLEKKVATEYVCLFHGGKAGARARSWWEENVGAMYQAGDVLQAVEFAQKYAIRPDYIFVQRDGDFLRVVSRGVNPQNSEVA